MFLQCVCVCVLNDKIGTTITLFAERTLVVTNVISDM